MFFKSWDSLLRIVLVGIPAYAALVLMLRIAGKRTLAKMNAFDLVVTVAFGSTLASLLTSSDVALSDGIAAFALLILLQYVVAHGSVRWRAVSRLVKASPRLLYFRGRFLDDALHAERVTREEILAAIRSEAMAAMEDVAAVVLETDGTFTVVAEKPDRSLSALAGVRGLPDEVRSTDRLQD